MKNNKKHILIGTCICALTMLLFLVFYKQLPENVPMQITMDGTSGNSLPKPLFVFGLPIIFVIINLIKNIPLLNKENISIYSFYTISVISVVLSILILMLALG